jgi:membrane fusion protein, heavy metal efflux system
MNRVDVLVGRLVVLAAVAALGFGTVSCRGSNADAGAPPAAVVETTAAGSVARVDHPERYPLVAAERYETRTTITATGVVSPDINRAIPVVSMAAGRVVELPVRLGDRVREKQLLVRILSGDASGAYSDYRHAVADEVLAKAQLERSKLLFEKGAIAQKDLEVAQDTEDKAIVDLESAQDKLRLMGGDRNHAPTGVVDVVAPISGVITEQNISKSGRTDNAPNLFTISDMSRVWVVCDVYENDLPNVRVGDAAEIRVNAHTEEVIKGRVDNILPILDANIRTAKVRVEVPNPGFLNIGMFATAIFRGQKAEVRAAVPASAILHLHDRDWVYEPEGAGGFKRVEVKSGEQLSDGRQEIRAGLEVGQRVVSNALALQNTVEQ